ncbi:MAG TPA: TonB-dependent receptor [Caulobacteraceae bacterium]|nr:TonB-dependent receptor [Caulobacteraceae bacterium]
MFSNSIFGALRAALRSGVSSAALDRAVGFQGNGGAFSPWALGRIAGLTALCGCAVHVGSACAQEASAATANPAGLAEVVVTAQRRAENLQIVPISVTVLTGQSVANSGFQSLTDLQYLVPGVQFDPTNGAAFQIRGVGSTSFDFSNEKSVNVVVDDVVMDGQRENGLEGLEDIQRVDVLMGPQGTLFGKNSTSGAISVTTADPSLGKFEGNASVSYGERNDRNVNLVLNAPITSQIAARVTAFEQGQDGVGEYTTLHKKLGSFAEEGYRLKLLYEPNDKLQIVFANDYAHHWDDTIRTPVAGASATVTAEELALGVTPGPQNANDADSSMGQIVTESFGDTLHVKYKIGGDTLTSISAYRATIYRNNTPADLLPANEYAYIPFNDGALKTSKVSEELRWASPTGQFLEYLGGLFYNKLIADQTQLQWATLGAPLVSSTGVPLTQLYALTGAIGASGNEAYFQARNTSAAMFGQLKFNLTDKFNIAFGARYSYDDNTQAISYPTVASAPITGTVDTFVATSAQPAYPRGGVSATNFSYRISPQYRIDNNIMVYASYSTGYKPPGVAFVSNKYDPYRAETVDALEVGEKSELFDHRLRINFDVFQEKFTNFQATTLTTIPGAIVQQLVIGNAGGLTSEGAEATFAVRPTNELTFNGSVTYTDAWFTKYIYNATTSYTGSSLTNAPRWAASVSADYEHTIGSVVKLRANISDSYRSSVWTVVGEPSYSYVPGYNLVNGRISLSPTNSNLQVGIYARNLLNTYFSTGWQQYGALGLLHYTTLDAYRTVGVFVKYGF